jgi:ketosteroid isomerase-like protein
LFFLVLSTLSCSTSNGRVIRDEIISRERQSLKAWKAKDKHFYDEYWGSDMTEFTPWTPELVRKPEQMSEFAKNVKAWKIHHIDIVDPDVRVYGDVALLTYRENVVGQYEGKSTRYLGKVKMIYVRRDGRWQGVHYHESVETPGGLIVNPQRNQSSKSN